MEPPVLLSRALMFVLASSVVVLAALSITLIKMIPLERPEVFFLLTPTRSTNLTIEPMSPNVYNETTIENYKEGFIREYVIARNTIVNGTNSYITKDNWIKIVKPWSGAKVYDDFTDTKIYRQYLFNEQSPAKSCDVYFSNTNSDKAILNMGNDLYNVKFYWVCKNISGQTEQNFYKIKIRIQSELEKKTSELMNDITRLRDNPLGIQVVEYIIEDGKQDPLDSDSEI